MNDVLNAIKNRRSVRKYKPDQISQEELDLILEAGMYAPSYGNQQPWHFTVIQNQNLLEHIDRTIREEIAEARIESFRSLRANPDFRATYGAPTLVVVSGRKDGSDWRVDCSAAIQNMLLAAESLNIGSVWLGFMTFYFERKEEVEKLGIPEGYEPFYGVLLGYRADDQPAFAPKRNMDVVNYIR